MQDNNFIESLLQDFKSGKFKSSLYEVYYLKRGAAIDPSKEGEVIAERYNQYMSNKELIKLINPEEALVKIVNQVKEEVILGFSLYTSKVVINFGNLKETEERLLKIESEENFYNWVR